LRAGWCWEVQRKRGQNRTGVSEVSGSRNTTLVSIRRQAGTHTHTHTGPRIGSSDAAASGNVRIHFEQPLNCGEKPNGESCKCVVALHLIVKMSRDHREGAYPSPSLTQDRRPGQNIPCSRPEAAKSQRCTKCVTVCIPYRGRPC
jgi:hypothetical protein